MKTVRLIGSNILFDLAHNHRSGDFRVLDSILWHSPFAVVDPDHENRTEEENIDEGTGESAAVLSLELKKNLEEIVSLNPTEYVIIESMGACWYDLLERGGKVYTNCRFIGNSEWYKAHKEEFKVISLRNNSKLDWKKYFDEFIRVIKKFYTSENIIYIRSHFPEYCKVKTVVKDIMLSPKNNILMRQIDDYFIEATDCKEISIGKNFFTDIESKYGNKVCFYENDFYSTLLENINYAIADKRGQKIFDKIKYGVRLKRYIECYESIQFNNLRDAFWKKEKWLEELTLFLGKKALILYETQLLTMADNDVKSISDMAECVDSNKDTKDLFELARIINAIKEKNYKEVVNWHLAFQYEIEALKLLHNDIKNILMSKFSVEDVDFTLEKNFKLAQAYIFEREALDNILPDALERRYELDVWGSCVTREIFNNDRTKWAGIKKYICRNCLLFSFDKPVDYAGWGIDFSDLGDFGNNEWRRRVVLSSLNRENVKWLEESGSEWLILDLYDIAKKNIFRYKNEYFCLGGRWLSYNFFNKIADKIGRVNVFDFDDEYLAGQFNKFISFCRERYGNNIILCNVFWRDKYIDSSNLIQSMSGVKEEYGQKTAFVRKWESYLRANMDCYYIDIAKYFYADEINPYILNGVHYELSYYDEMARIIKEIITCKPDKRVYEEVSVRCTLDRAIRLKSLGFEMYNQYMNVKNNVALRLIYLLERIVVEEYIDVFEQIYRNNYDSIRSCYETFCFELWGAEALKRIIRKYAE